VDGWGDEFPGEKSQPIWRKIGKILVPGIPDRRMDITDMESIRTGDYPLGHTMGAGYHKIEVLEVKKLDGQRKERQVRPVFFPDKRHALEKAGENFSAFDGLDLASGKMKKCKNGSLGKNFSQYFQDFLSPALAREPVVHEGHLQIFH
jgi:hypothetical protein